MHLIAIGDSIRIDQPKKKAEQCNRLQARSVRAPVPKPASALIIRPLAPTAQPALEAMEADLP
jgi:hypothetical protein